MKSHDAVAPLPNPDLNQEELVTVTTRFNHESTPVNHCKGRLTESLTRTMPLTPCAEQDHASASNYVPVQISKNSYQPHLEVQQEQKPSFPIWWSMMEKDGRSGQMQSYVQGQMQSYVQPAGQYCPPPGSRKSQAMALAQHQSKPPPTNDEYRKNAVAPPGFSTDDWDSIGFSIPSPTSLWPRTAY